MGLTSQKLFKYAVLMGTRGSTIVTKFVLSIFIARFAGLDVLGAYGLIVGLTLGLPVVLRAGLFTSLMRDLVDIPTHEVIHQLSHYIIWIVGIYAFLLPFAISADMLNLWPQYAGIATMLWAVVLVEHLAVDLVMLFNTLRRPNSANFFGLLQAMIWAIPFMIAAYFWPENRSIQPLLMFWITGTALCIFITYFVFFRLPLHKTIIDFGWFPTKIKDSALLFWRDNISVLALYADRYIIAITLGLELTGVYTLFYQLANSLYTVVNSSVVQMHRPDIVVGFRERKTEAARKRLNILLRESVLIMLTLGTALAVAFYWLAPYIERPLLVQYQTLLWFVLIAITTRVAMHVILMEHFAKREDRHLVKSQLTEALCALAIPLCLTGLLGPYAAPLGIFLGCSLVMLTSRGHAHQ